MRSEACTDVSPHLPISLHIWWARRHLLSRSLLEAFPTGVHELAPLSPPYLPPYLPPISLYLPAGVHELLGAIGRRTVRAALAARDCGDMAALGALTAEAQGTSTTRP